METWSRAQWENKKKEFQDVVFYLYTPICGTCAVATKMLEVIAELKPELEIGKADLNFVQDIAIDYEIESVPCLLIQKDGAPKHKVYAFQSIPDLLEKIG
jgi:thioredoxin 1